MVNRRNTRNRFNDFKTPKDKTYTPSITDGTFH